MVVGVISGHSARRIIISHRVSGNFDKMSLAVDSINSYLFPASPEEADANCIKSKFSQFNLAEFVK